jgi:hypothetical protein
LCSSRRDRGLRGEAGRGTIACVKARWTMAGPKNAATTTTNSATPAHIRRTDNRSSLMLQRPCLQTRGRLLHAQTRFASSRIGGMATANLSSVDILPAANRAPFVARLSQSIVRRCAAHRDAVRQRVSRVLAITRRKKMQSVQQPSDPSPRGSNSPRAAPTMRAPARERPAWRHN